MPSKSLTRAFTGLLVALLMMACQSPPIPSSVCEHSVLYTVEAWEDVNGNQKWDESEKPLSGITFEAAWYGNESAMTGHAQRETVITGEDGSAELFVDGCESIHPAAVHLKVEVVSSPGYRLSFQRIYGGILSFGFTP